MDGAEQPMGDVANVFLFENDRVKVWHLILEPGEASPRHQHPRDYITIVLEGNDLRVVFDDGQVDDRKYNIGDVFYRSKHIPHYAFNTGSVRYKNVLIELKE